MSHEARTSIYMDHAATTPMDPAVIAAMLPYFDSYYGNPSSLHSIGRRAGAAVADARQSIADLLGARPNEVIFNACGTEGDNAALRGIALARREATGANRIITLPLEHKAVLETAADLRRRYGFEVSLAPVDSDGLVAPDDVAALLGDDVALVSVMLANNEIGAIQPVAAIGALCRARGIPFHTDAVQAVGKVPVNVDALNVDALSASAHKFYGPKGIGFLYLRRGTPFLPVMTGGSHEGGRRAGTENVPSIVGMARALHLAEQSRGAEALRLRALRDRLMGGILEGVEGARLTGPRGQRLDNHASFVISGVEAEGVLIALDLAGVAASSGSACTSGAQRPSHVLEAIGVPATDAVGALRLSLGRSNSVQDVEYVLEQLPAIVQRIRGMTPAVV